MSFAKSPQSKIILFLALISMIITLIKYLSLKILLVQGIIFYIFLYNADCHMYGRCYSSAYFNLIIAAIITLFLICDYFGIFNEYKRIVRRLFTYYESSNGSNLRQIIFPKEEEISDYYKKRELPKLVNKNFKHKPINEELEEEELLNSENSELNSLLNNNIGLGL